LEQSKEFENDFDSELDIEQESKETSSILKDTSKWERIVRTRKSGRKDVYYYPEYPSKTVRLRSLNDVKRYCEQNWD
jgi:hypothetical protein